MPTIRKHPKKGHWEGALQVNGVRRWVTGQSRQEVLAKLAALQREAALGHLQAPTKLTLREWTQEWLAGKDLRPATLRTYRQVLDAVSALIGETPLPKLTPALIAGALQRLKRQGMGTRRLQMAHTYLKAALRTAVDLGLLLQNPCDRVPKPKHESAPKRYWSLDEARAFLTTAQESRLHYAPLLITLLGTGLRLGEALALEWQDIDWENRRLRVDKALVQAGTAWHLVRPKTRAGERWVPLPAFVLATLQRLPRPLDPTRRVFLSAIGTTPTPSNIRRDLQTLCRRAGVPYLSPHALRHAAAALMVAGGADPKVIQRVLGHASVWVSLQVYAYAARSEHQAAAALEKALGG